MAIVWSSSVEAPGETTNRGVIDPEALERRTREIGRELFDRIGRGPSPWQRAWWDDRLMDLTMGDPEVKVQLFRFIDALPALQTPESVRRHLAEYLDEAGDARPLVAAAWRSPWPRRARTGERLLAVVGAVRGRRTWPAGSSPARRPPRPSQTVRRSAAAALAFTADLLGEAVISEAEADAYQQTCLDLIRGLAGPLAAEPEVPQIDRDDHGPIPRVNLSLKLTSLTARFDALHAEATDRRRRRPAPADPPRRPASSGRSSTSTWSSTPTRT